MTARELLETKAYGEHVGLMVWTQPMGDYPGGLAKITELHPDPAAPEIAFNVRHPNYGEVGVFDFETVMPQLTPRKVVVVVSPQHG